MPKKNISKALQKAIELQNSGNLLAAKKTYIKILKWEKNNVDANHLLGIIYLLTGKSEQAISSIKRAIREKPDFGLAHNNLGICYKSTNNFNLAANSFRKAIKYSPNNADAFNNLGATLIEQGLTNAAINALKHAIKINPHNTDAYTNLGVAQNGMSYFNDAIESFEAALKLSPANIEIQTNIANIYFKSKQFAEAATKFTSIIKQDPSNPKLFNALGNSFKRLGEFAKSQDCFEMALTLDPKNTDTLNNLGILLLDQIRTEQAIKIFRSALVINPEDATSHGNLSQALLLSRNFGEGWTEYEWRFKAPGCKPIHPHLPANKWNGDSLSGKRILLIAEQGLGDTIQFVRYVKTLKSLYACTITLACQKSLLVLLSDIEGLDKIISKTDILPDVDVYAPLLSLPLLMNIDLKEPDTPVPYLEASKDLQEIWEDKLLDFKGLRIGLVWQGNSKHPRNCYRSFDLNALLPLSAIKNICWFSLQKDKNEDPLTHYAGPIPITSWHEELDTQSGPFMDTAAIISILDIVITADTSIAHLAGALGAKVWLALPASPDWRWFLDADKSIWYKDVSLFRQKKIDDWSPVFKQMADELKKLANQDKCEL